MLRRASLRFLKPAYADGLLKDPNSPLLIENLDPKTRSQLQAQQLQDYVKNSKFFSELEPKAQQTCIEHMFFQVCNAGEVKVHIVRFPPVRRGLSILCGAIRECGSPQGESSLRR